MGLTLPSVAAKHNPEATRALLAALSPDIQLDILVPHAERARVSGWMAELGRTSARVIAAPGALDFSLRGQDGVLSRKDGSMLRPRGFARNDDAQAAAVLARAAKRRVSPVDYHFEGGNVIACGAHLLVGADTAEANRAEHAGYAELLDPTRAAVVIEGAAFLPGESCLPEDQGAEDWQEVTRPGQSRGSRQPVFQIDRFVAPAGLGAGGEARFVVGCPALGARIASEAEAEDADQTAFDEIAAALVAIGAEVHRAPMPLVTVEDPLRRRRLRLLLPVAAVLVERAKGLTRVHLPAFSGASHPGLDAIDAANRALWESLGFEVLAVPGLLALAPHLGALNGIARVVERGPAG